MEKRGTDSLKKQFVSFEIASRLNQLGYDEVCLAYYYRSDFYFCKMDIFTGYDECCNTYFNDFQVACPLCQQAFDWLKVKYKINNLYLILDDDISVREKVIINQLDILIEQRLIKQTAIVKKQIRQQLKESK